MSACPQQALGVTRGDGQWERTCSGLSVSTAAWMRPPDTQGDASGTTLPRRCCKAAGDTLRSLLAGGCRNPMAPKDGLHLSALHEMEVTGVGSALPPTSKWEPGDLGTLLPPKKRVPQRW